MVLADMKIVEKSDVCGQLRIIMIRSWVKLI